MKKIFAILAAAVMVVVCASSCNKVAKTLAGTQWECSVLEGKTTVQYNLSFEKDAKFVLSAVAGSESMSVSGTYSYTYPNVAITASFDPDDDPETFTCTVSSDYKTITLMGEDEYKLVFNRVK